MSYSLRFSQAIEIIIFIAMKSEREFYDYLSIPKIAEGLNIPVPSVKKLIGMLKVANLILSKPGVSGGLALTKTINEINLYDVLSAVEGEGILFPIYENFDIENFPDKNIVIPVIKNSRNIFQGIQEQMVASLRATTLLDLFHDKIE
ncbi:MAG: Rrf2 family transcriptional regulator [Streptococcaceae bacterium]|nr:Rrf2 family transcriptional regulator [Streptococcaceae bacterium]